MTTFTRWLLAPLHALALATTAKSFRDNPIIGSPALNRRGLHLARKRLAARLGTRRRGALAGGIPPAERAAFDRDGYLVLPGFLPVADFAALRAEILALNTPAREFVDGYTLTRLIPLDAAALAALPATRAALAGPRYLGLHHYIGSSRRHPHLFVQSVFSRVQEAPPDVQCHFHADTFQPTVKSWLYLTDVAEDVAAFTYVPGSHHATRRHLAWERRASIAAGSGADVSSAEGSLRVSEAELARLGYPAPRKLAVAANTLVIADTSGFHRRGLSDRPGTRISIWAYSRSNPFLPWAGGGLLSAPAIRGHVVRGFWAMQDLLRRLAGGKGGWRWVGARSPAAPPTP